LRAFVRTESGSATVLVAGIVAALVWANIDDSSYETVWRTDFTIALGRYGITQDLRTWLNSGLMTLFFLVVGLETRREFDLGDLRERRRFVLPIVAGVAGMIIPVGIYLLINQGRLSVHGWGVAMSTDTALALGVLAVLGRDIPDRMRVFVLTVFVVDDLAALVVIAVAYSDRVTVTPLLVAVAAFALLLLAVRLRLRRRMVFVALGILIWGMLRTSGVDPIVAGLAIGLAAPAYTPARDELRAATGLGRRFREQPTPELAKTARVGLSSTLSPNARLQTFFHPWTSYLIVPLFALANAGIVLNADFLSRAYTAPITLGVLVGYVVGKPLAVVSSSWGVTRLSRGRIRPPIGDAAVVASGTIAGIGFTVALLIADRAFHGEELDQAKLGALSAAVLAALVTWAVLRITAFLPDQRRAKALLGDPRLIQDLIPAVDPDRDHVRGPHRAAITVIEFGDFECPYCGQAEPVVRELLADTTIGTCGGTCPSPTCTLGPSWPPKPPKPPPPKAPSGPCTTCSCDTKTPSPATTCCAMPSGWISMPPASAMTSMSVPTPPASPRTSNRPISAASPALPPSSSTDNGTTAPTTSTPSPQRSTPNASDSPPSLETRVSRMARRSARGA